MTEELGRRMFSQNIVLRGYLGDAQWIDFIVRAVKDLGMTPAGPPAVWKYPIEDGKGGEGMTACQPIVESFLVIDTWTDLAGAYLHISSCKEFSVGDLVNTILDFGLSGSCGARETLKLDPVPPVNHLDDYPEETAHSGAPSDPRLDPVEG